MEIISQNYEKILENLIINNFFVSKYLKTLTLILLEFKYF